MKLLLLAVCVLAAGASGKDIDFDDDDLTDDLLDIKDEDDVYIGKHTPVIGKVAPEDVNFTIYSRDNCTAPVFLNDTPAECFNSRRPTKILIHGFLARGRTFLKMKDAYLQTGDYNVIVVDWSQVAACWHSSKLSALIKLCYNSIVKSYLDSVSSYVSELMEKLQKEGQDSQDVHVVGHSLGAHIAGQASDKARLGRQLGRITGLDPASPLLKFKNLTKVLDEKDAMFVDVIHTNVNYLGWKRPLGTADFYPYDGKGQPGCSFPSSVLRDILVTTTAAGHIKELAYRALELHRKKCSHSKSHKYFTQTILDAWSFVAIPCGILTEYDRHKCIGPDVVYMGENVPHSARGSYYVTAVGGGASILGLPSPVILLAAGLASMSSLQLRLL